MLLLWSALNRDKFDPKLYLYHYTSFETALKILYSGSFRLSPLSNTNDTTEQKCRVSYAFKRTDEMNGLITCFENEWQKLVSNSKLLCFSQDHKKSSTFKNADFNIFDVSGRGFALPRMWAQYSNNNGVCIIVEKNKLLDLVKESFPNAIYQPVRYRTDNNRFEFSEETLRQVCNILNAQHNLEVVSSFLQKKDGFINYAFFSKSNDWSNECEYRVFVPTSEPGFLWLKGIQGCIAGLVVGEKIDESKSYVLQKIWPSIKMRRIVFEPSRCTLENFRQV